MCVCVCVCGFFVSQSKEAEASRLAVELRAGKEREAALSRDLAMAKASLVSVQGMVRDMQATNDELLVRLEALEVNMMFKVCVCVCVCVCVWCV